MPDQMFHVFRNSPLGRENLMQAAYFCKMQFGLSLAVRIPICTRFVMPFKSGEVVCNLDSSYVQASESARAHAEEILAPFKVEYSFFEPAEFAEPSLPVIPVQWTIMSCPRVISEKISRIGLGTIGPRVRDIVKHARFPLFIPALAYKPWNSVAAFFGGSELGATVVREAIAIARLGRVPLTVYTQLDGITREECEQVLAAADLLSELGTPNTTWKIFESGTLEENLFHVPHDSLAVAGAAGHGLITELLFGSKLETIQSTLPNPLVLIGPNCRPRVKLD